MITHIHPRLVDARGVSKLRRDSPGPAPAFPDLAALLWTVRESLELVLFKLVEVRLILTTGAARWLARADSELRAALEDLHAVEVLRAVEVAELVRSLGGSAGATLADLARAAPEPWPAMLAEHRGALAALLVEIELVGDENRRLLSEEPADRAAQRSTASAAESSPAIGSHQRSTEVEASSRASLQAALSTTSAIPQLSLRDFLA